MSAEQRCHSDVLIHNGTHYTVLETIEEIDLNHKWVTLTSWTGSGLMPPTRIRMQVNHISSVRALSEEDWIFTKQATDLHYARQIRELEKSDAERLIEQQTRLVDALEGRSRDDDE